MCRLWSTGALSSKNLLPLLLLLDYASYVWVRERGSNLRQVLKATRVSDGVVIEFDEELICYFPADELISHRLELGAQLLVDHDPGLDELEAESGLHGCKLAPWQRLTH